MTPGVPGAGVMMLFYVLTALWVPLREVALVPLGHSRGQHRRHMWMHATLALGIVLALGVTWGIVVPTFPDTLNREASPITYETPRAIAPLFYLVLIPLLVISTQHPLFLLGYVLDAPAVLVPVLYKATARREVGRAVVSVPAYFVLRAVNAYFFYEALWMELVMRKRLRSFEKGH